jgi:excisionase family DNA binding protein
MPARKKVPTPKSTPTSRAQASDWLSLQQASQLLGVHPATVRLWADQGKLKSIRTAGGHRRFSQQDVSKLLAPQTAAPASTEKNAQLIVQSALGRTRMELTSDGIKTQSWYQHYDEQTREQHRQLGRRLFGLTLHYLNHQNERAQILQDARKLGSEYGHLTRKHIVLLPDAMRAFLYFRDFLLESVLQIREVVGAQMSDDYLLTYRLINEFANEVLIAMVSTYQGR